MCRRAAEPRYTGFRPARRAEVALLFLVQEAATHTVALTSAGAYRGAGLSFHAKLALLFLVQEAASRGPPTRRGGGRTRLKSNNPNAEGGEK